MYSTVSSFSTVLGLAVKLTVHRKLSYCKADRAMRPTARKSECPEKFWYSCTPTATFRVPKIFSGLFYQLMLRMCVHNLKFVALAIRPFLRYLRVGLPKKFGQSLNIRPRSPRYFIKIFNGLFFGWTLWMFVSNLKFVASSVPEIIVIGVLGGGCKPSILGGLSLRGSKMVPFERALWVPIGNT